MKFNLRGVPLRYVIMRYEIPEMVNFTDEIYESDPEQFRMIAPHLTEAV